MDAMNLMEATAKDVKRCMMNLDRCVNYLSDCRKKSQGVLDNYKAEYLTMIKLKSNTSSDNNEQAGAETDMAHITLSDILDEEIIMLNLAEALI